MGVGLVNGAKDLSYQSLVDGNLTRTDTTINFPKSLFIDRDSSIWISDMNDILRVKNNKIKKYHFDEKYSSEDYKRSFSLIENEKGHLLVASWSGYIFYYNRAEDKFQKISFKNEGTEYLSSIRLVKNKTWIGTQSGIYELNISTDYKKVNLKQIVSMNYVSSFTTGGTDEIFIGTWLDGFHIYNLLNGDYSKINEIQTGVINAVYKDQKGIIWLATDNGITIIKKHIFKKVDFSDANMINNKPYVRRLKIKANNQISFLADFKLFNLNYRDKNLSVVQVPINQTYNIIDYEYSDEGLWISHLNGLLELYNENLDLLYQHSFQSHKLEFLFSDSNGSLWGFSYYLNKIFRITKNKEIQSFDTKITHNTLVQNIKQFEDKIYFGGLNKNFNYFFSFDLKTEKFEFCEINESDDTYKELHIFDFEKQDSQFFFATNKGLLRFADKNISELNFDNEHKSNTFRSILIDSDNIWTGSDQGINFWQYNNSAQFKKSSGLANSTISKHGLIKDQFGTVWAGTASGLSYLVKENQISSNSTPKIVSIEIKSQNIIDKNVFLSGSNIFLEFASFEYPTEKVKYLTKISGLDNNWEYRGSTNFLDLKQMPVGSYEVLVRAKNSGNLWSEALTYKFEVVPPWYFSSYMISLYVLVLIVLTWYLLHFAHHVKIKKLESRKQILEDRVNKRTKLLKKEKKKVEKLLKESEQDKLRLQNVNESKNELINIIAHDLKNPLQSILGYEFILEDENKSEIEINDVFQSIFRSSKKMNSLITDYLESAAIDSENMEFNFSNYDINNIIEELLEESREIADRKKIKIQYQLVKSSKIYVDKNWLKIAIYNLISNSIKYSPFGKTIFIKCEIEVRELKCSVRDEGPGISKEDQEELFMKFKRLSAKPTGNETATGLGLYIVKDIVAKHNGYVTCDSEIGKGSIFTIHLPLHEK